MNKTVNITRREIAQRKRDKLLLATSRQKLLGYVVGSSEGPDALKSDAWKRISAGIITLAIALCIFFDGGILHLLGFIPPPLFAVRDLRHEAKYNKYPLTDADLSQTDQLIIGTRGGGVQEYTTASGLWGYWKTNDVVSHPLALTENNIAKVVSYPKGVLIIQSNGALAWADSELNQWRMITGKNGFVPFLSEQDIAITRVSSDGRLLLIGTQKYGLGIYDIDRHDWVPQEQIPATVRGRNIRDVKEIGDLIWVATDRGVTALEVFRESARPLIVSEHKAYQFNQSPVREVIGMAEAGSIFAVTDQGGLLFLDTLSKSAWIQVIGENGFRATDVRPIQQQITDVLIWKGMLWMATDGSGVGRYNPKMHDWHTFTTANGLPSNQAKRLVATDNALYVATSLGITRLAALEDGTTWNWQIIKGSNGNLFSLAAMPDGVLAVLEEDQNNRKLCMIYDSEDYCGRLLSPTRKLQTDNEIILAVAVSQGDYWIVSRPYGVWQYHVTSRSWEKQGNGLPNFSEVTAADLQSSGSRLWLRVTYTNGNGDAFVYDSLQWQNLPLVLDQTSQMASDLSGSWFLQSGGVLARVDNDFSKTEFFKPLPSSTLIDHWNSFVRSAEIVYAANDDGLFSYNINTHNWEELLQTDSIRDLTLEPSGTLLITTKQNGLQRFSPGTKDLAVIIPDVSTDQTGLRDGAGFSSAVKLDKDRILLAGSGENSNRLFEYNLSTRRLRGLPQLFDGPIVQIRSTGSLIYTLTRNVEADAPVCASQLPVNAAGWGQLYIRDTEQDDFYPVNSYASDIAQIVSYSGHLFGRNACGELIVFKGRSVEINYFQGQYISTGQISGIVQTPDGRIWVAQNGNIGMQVFNPTYQSWKSLAYPSKVIQILLVDSSLYAIAEDGVYLLEAGDRFTRVQSGKVLSSAAVNGKDIYILIGNGAPLVPSVWHVANGKSDLLLSFTPRTVDPIIQLMAKDETLWTITTHGQFQQYNFLTHSWNEIATITPKNDRLIALGNGVAWWFDEQQPNALQEIFASGKSRSLQLPHDTNGQIYGVIRLINIDNRLYVYTENGWLTWMENQSKFVNIYLYWRKGSGVLGITSKSYRDKIEDRLGQWGFINLTPQVWDEKVGASTTFDRGNRRVSLLNGSLELKIDQQDIYLTNQGVFENDQPASIAASSSSLYLFSDDFLTIVDTNSRREAALSYRSHQLGQVKTAVSDGTALHILSTKGTFISTNQGETWQPEPTEDSIITRRQTIYEEKGLSRQWVSSLIAGTVAGRLNLPSPTDMSIKEGKLWLFAGEITWNVHPDLAISPGSPLQSPSPMRQSESWTEGELHGWNWTVTYDSINRADIVEIKSGNWKRDRFFKGQFADDMINGTANNTQMVFVATQSGIWESSFTTLPTAQKMVMVNTPWQPAMLETAFSGNSWFALAQDGSVWETKSAETFWQRSAAQKEAIIESRMETSVLGIIMESRLGGVYVNQTEISPDGKAFSFDLLTSLAVLDNQLWLASGNRVFATDSVSTQAIQYTQAFTPTLEHIQNLKPYRGELWLLDSKQETQVYKEQNWVKASTAQSPFYGDPELDLPPTNLSLTWIQNENGGIHVNIMGRPARFVNGDFDFDLPLRASTKSGEIFWADTQGGYFAYSMNQTPPSLHLQSDSSLPSDLFTQRAVSIGIDQINSQELLGGAFINCERLPLRKDNLFGKDGKFVFDHVNAVISLDKDIGIATDGGVLVAQAVDGLLKIKQWQSVPQLEDSVSAIRAQAGDLYIRSNSQIMEADTKSADWEWQPSNKTDLFEPISVIYKDGKWSSLSLTKWWPLGINKNATTEAASFSADGRFAFDVILDAVDDSQGAQLVTQDGLWLFSFSNESSPSFQPDFTGRRVPISPSQIDGNGWRAKINPASGNLQISLSKNIMDCTAKVFKLVPLNNSAFFAMNQNHVIKVDVDRLRNRMIGESSFRVDDIDMICTQIPDVVITPTVTPTVTQLPLPTGMATLTVTSTAIPVPTVSTITPTPTNTALPKAIVLESANLRSGPGVIYPVIISYVTGTELTAIGRNQDASWLFVTVKDGRKGWISAKLVRLMTNIYLLPDLEYSVTPVK